MYVCTCHKGVRASGAVYIGALTQWWTAMLVLCCVTVDESGGLAARKGMCGGWGGRHRAVVCVLLTSSTLDPSSPILPSLPKSWWTRYNCCSCTIPWMSQLSTFKGDVAAPSWQQQPQQALAQQQQEVVRRPGEAGGGEVWEEVPQRATSWLLLVQGVCEASWGLAMHSGTCQATRASTLL